MCLRKRLHDIHFLPSFNFLRLKHAYVRAETAESCFLLFIFLPLRTVPASYSMSFRRIFHAKGLLCVIELVPNSVGQIELILFIVHDAVSLSEET